jgi:hypothetical protein
MFERLRRYEVQAIWSLALAVISAAPAAAAGWLALRNYDDQLGRIIYGLKGSFLATFTTCLAASMVAAFVGFAMGWNSAGQPRNDRSGASWVGFFLGGTVLSLNVILLVAFLMLRLRMEG